MVTVKVSGATNRIEITGAVAIVSQVSGFYCSPSKLVSCSIRVSTPLGLSVPPSLQPALQLGQS